MCVLVGGWVFVAPSCAFMLFLRNFSLFLISDWVLYKCVRTLSDQICHYVKMRKVEWRKMLSFDFTAHGRGSLSSAFTKIFGQLYANTIEEAIRHRSNVGFVWRRLGEKLEKNFSQNRLPFFERTRDLNAPGHVDNFVLTVPW